MRIDLWVLAAVAAFALAALIDSARRAATIMRIHQETPRAMASTSLQSALHNLERQRIQLEPTGPRWLMSLAIFAAMIGVLSSSCLFIPEPLAALGSVSVGLLVPGLAWDRELRSRRAEIVDQIAAIRRILGQRHSTAFNAVSRDARPLGPS